MGFFSFLLSPFQKDSHAAEIARFKSSIQRNPRDKNLLAQYAKFCLRGYFTDPGRTGHLDAVERFESVDHSDLFDPELYYLIGRYHQVGDPKKAKHWFLEGIKRFNQYIEKNPGLKQDHMESALATALNLIALQPDHVDPEVGKFFKSVRKSYPLHIKRVELDSEVEKGDANQERIQELTQEINRLKAERDLKRSKGMGRE